MEEETNGFKFAILLLATFGSIIYGTFDYFQNNAEDSFNYSLISAIITILTILSFLLIFYVLIKGIITEIQAESLKNSLKNYASDIYLISFFAASMTLIFIVGVFFFAYLGSGIYGFYIVELITGLIIIITLYLCRNEIEARLKRIGLKHIGFSGAILILFSIFLTYLLLWIPLFDIVKESPLQGHIVVDMESFYYKNDSLIPVFIQVTGHNTGLNILLYKEDMSNLVGPKGQIHLKSEHNQSNIIYGHNSVLFGNTLENGKYSIFINTSNLTEGYYELSFLAPTIDKDVTKNFYLFNT